MVGMSLNVIPSILKMCEQLLKFCMRQTRHGQQKLWMLLDLLVRTSDSLSKKWTGDPPMYRAFSRGQSFETHTNWFALIPQIHGAQPGDHRREQALISSG